MEQRDVGAKGHRDRDAELQRKLGDVYKRHLGHVLRALWRFGVQRRSDREDVAQDVFRVALEKLDEYDAQRGEMEVWLHGIAWNRAADFRKLHRHRAELPADEMEESPARDADPERATATAETRGIVLDIIDSAIDVNRQAVFALSELEGHTAKEIAEALMLRVTTVEGRLRLAREQFRAEVARRTKRRKLGPEDVLGVLLLTGNEHLREILPDLPPSTDVPHLADATDAIGANADPASRLPLERLASPALQGAWLFFAGVVAGAVGIHLIEHAAPSPALARPLPSPVETATAVTVAPAPTLQIAPPVMTVTAVATARATAEPSSDPPRMDKEIVERMRQQEKAEEREKLAQRHRQAYGDNATAEERDAAAAEGMIASGTIDAARPAVEAFRRKYPGSVHQARLDGLIARKQTGAQAKGAKP